VAAFLIYSSEPPFQDVPVLNAGVATEELPMLALIKQSKFRGYAGLPDVE
jgi:hypothetical protein